MRTSGKATVLVILAVTICLGGYAMINLLNIPNRWANPIPTSNTWTFNIFYPQQSAGVIFIQSMNQTYGQYLSIDVRVTGDNPLIASHNVVIEAVGSASPAFVKQMQTVTIGYNGATIYGLGSGEEIGGNCGCVSLAAKSSDLPWVPSRSLGLSSSYLLGASEQIEFPYPTFYYLTLAIVFANSTSPVVVNYETQNVYVYPEDYYLQQALQRFNTTVSLMTLIDVVVGAVGLAIGAFKSNGQSSNTTQEQKPMNKKHNAPINPQPKKKS